MIIKVLCYEMWDAIKLLFRRNFIALNDYVRKGKNERETNELSIPLKKSGKAQTNSKQ